MIRKNHKAEGAQPTSSVPGESGDEEFDDKYRGMTTRFPQESEVVLDAILGMLMLDGWVFCPCSQKMSVHMI
jgi:hypothetical protein